MSREAERRLKHICPFCRQPAPSTTDEVDKYRMKRINMNDPVAMTHKGIEKEKNGDYISVFEYYTKAAELGDVEAHYKLSLMFMCRFGDGVEKDSGDKYTIWKKLLLVVIPVPGTSLDALRKNVVILRGQ